MPSNVCQSLAQQAYAGKPAVVISGNDDERCRPDQPTRWWVPRPGLPGDDRADCIRRLIRAVGIGVIGGICFSVALFLFVLH